MLKKSCPALINAKEKRINDVLFSVSAQQFSNSFNQSKSLPYGGGTLQYQGGSLSSTYTMENVRTRRIGLHFTWIFLIAQIDAI